MPTATPSHETDATQTFDVVVIGGGQAGLSVGYHLSYRNIRFVILDASARVGDSWRHRWDSLRLFSPARYDALDGMPFPAPATSYPSKDAMADYLELYARRFALPVRSGVEVDGVRRVDDGYEVSAGSQRFRAAHVVIAMSGFQTPQLPSFAKDIGQGVRQLHSTDYRNPSQLRPGAVLLVGAGNSGAEIAVELARAGRKVTLAGPDMGMYLSAWRALSAGMSCRTSYWASCSIGS